MTQQDVVALFMPPGRVSLPRADSKLPVVDAGLGSRPDLSGFSSQYRSSRTRANFAIGLLGAIGGLSLLTAVHYVTGFGIIEDARAGVLGAGQANQFDATTQVLALVWLAVYVATAVAFLMWLSRAVDNVPSLTGERPVATPRWSIGWWFVPFANLYKPYQVTNDLAKRMAPPGVAVWLVLTWWLVWIASNLISLASLRLAEPENLEELGVYFSVNAVTEVASAAAAVLALTVVRRIQRHADARGRLAGIGGSDGQDHSSAPIPSCPRCGVPRVAGERLCANCGLDLWADFDQRAAERSGWVNRVDHPRATPPATARHGADGEGSPRRRGP